MLTLNEIVSLCSLYQCIKYTHSHRFREYIFGTILSISQEMSNKCINNLKDKKDNF